MFPTAQKTVSVSLFFNTVRISDKKFTCAAGNHATSQFAHKKKLTAQWFGPVVGLPAVNWNSLKSLTSLQFCPSGNHATSQFASKRLTA